MECLFYYDLDENLRSLIIEGEEFSHAKALRLKINEEVLFTNGKGLSAKGKLTDFDKKSMTFSLFNYSKNLGEINYKLVLAVGILQNKDRFEFLLEKAVELGVTDFIPLKIKNSQTEKLNFPRLNQKVLSATKQCKRSVFMKIHEVHDLDMIFDKYKNDFEIYCLDEDGEKLQKELSGNILILAGSEGGFTELELEKIKKKNVNNIHLVNRRLRTETAAIMGISILISNHI